MKVETNALIGPNVDLILEWTVTVEGLTDD